MRSRLLLIRVVYHIRSIPPVISKLAKRESVQTKKLEAREEQVRKRSPVEQKSQPLTYERSSVGARPSSAAPVE